MRSVSILSTVLTMGIAIAANAQQAIDLRPSAYSRQDPSLIDVFGQDEPNAYILHSKAHSTKDAAAFTVVNANANAATSFMIQDCQFARIANRNGDCIARTKDGALWIVQINWESPEAERVSCAPIPTAVPVIGGICVDHQSNAIWFSTSGRLGQKTDISILGHIDLDTMNECLFEVQSTGTRVVSDGRGIISIVSAQSRSEALAITDIMIETRDTSPMSPRALSPRNRVESRLPWYTVWLDGNHRIRMNVEDKHLEINGDKVAIKFANRPQPRAVRVVDSTCFIVDGSSVYIIDISTHKVQGVSIEGVVDSAVADAQSWSKRAWFLSDGWICSLSADSNVTQDLNKVARILNDLPDVRRFDSNGQVISP